MPDHVFCAGDLVHYHPVIGGPHVGIPYRVWAMSDLSDGRKVAWLIDKTGCVAIEHLTLVKRATPGDRLAIWQKDRHMPDPKFYVGDLVRYHPTIGGPLNNIPTSRIRQIIELPSGEVVATLIGKRGRVSAKYLVLVKRATQDDRYTVWLAMMRIRSTNPSQRAHFNSWERLQDLAAQQAELIAGQAEALESMRRLTRELDLALNGEAGAAKQASLCDLVAQVKTIKAQHGGRQS
jgi:hypothetical protein